MDRISTFLITLVLASSASMAQEDVSSHVLRAVVVNGDTIPVVQLPEAHVAARWSPKDRRDAERYTKLMRHVVKVYPYASLTERLLKEYEHDLAQIQRNSDQELYVKLAEAELRAEFEAEIKDLTVSQGKVLVKLIDRQTGQTSYELVKQLRGSFQAFIWQGLAQLFGQDLKSGYDREGEDNVIELIVQRIERGELPVSDRGPLTAKAQQRLEKRKARLYKKYGLSLDTSMH
ncbi:MAG: DUF4294 domain-containing protein [Flavobacteriales bacterium]|jgi:hypothetical protein|nr:DUF4294 domain-containing protein [Flavobacteriales bacterium]MBK6549343.1 DUF4294 domain-containing protein [Flavobacteriales bacterium]MBK6884068.1 DUF4294 domain-containing protein [Flavobacteriales bacterium]MBK7100458.1 DUF4294 domain-containing protein [Flavobacteriales bacterium]MBK7111153.1 DUF4294 domain-containing protein [Flavobacteriales bacterium]